MNLHEPVMKRSVVLAGHSTSVSLEKTFWVELQAIAEQKDLSLNALIAEIDAQRSETASDSNLSSALRLYVVHQLKS